MKDGNDFDFEDDFLDDDNEPFDFDEDEGFPSGLGDEFESDMPVIEEEQEERGTSRTFVFLAGVMIFLFIAALALVLFLATRPTGPTDLELTASQVVLLNQTVESQLALTSTQNAINAALTQTAAAWTATPLPTDTPLPSDTPTATQFRPTVTPTPTLDETALANAQLAAGALTLTALAGQATAVPTEGVNLSDLREAFATQVAFATEQGQFDVQIYETRIAIATQIANTSMDPAEEVALREMISGTEAAVIGKVDAVSTAIYYIDNALATAAVSNPALATQLAQVIPASLATQGALETPRALATQNAIALQQALGTLSAGNLEAFPPNSTPEAPGKVTAPEQSRAEQATQVALVPQQVQQDATAVAATRDAFATQAAVETRAVIATQQALATQQAFLTPAVISTQAAVATQNALGTRQALINLALGLNTPTPGNGLEAVNQTATAIAGAFLTATAQAVTPGAEVTASSQQAFPTLAVTALPDTGLFDDVVSGGSGGIGVLTLAVFGLIGVIVVSRRLRGVNERGAQRDEQTTPKE